MDTDTHDPLIDTRASEEADLRDHALIWREALATIIGLVEGGQADAYGTADNFTMARALDDTLDRVKVVASEAMKGVGIVAPPR